MKMVIRHILYRCELGLHRDLFYMYVNETCVARPLFFVSKLLLFLPGMGLLNICDMHELTDLYIVVHSFELCITCTSICTGVSIITTCKIYSYEYIYRSSSVLIFPIFPIKFLSFIKCSINPIFFCNLDIFPILTLLNRMI